MTHDTLRAKLHARLGIHPDNPHWDDTRVMFSEAKRVQNSLDEIVRLGKDRLLMGAIRYGANRKESWQSISARMRAKLNHYDKTGNREMLVDLVNYCALEYQNQTHPNSHFSALDDAVHGV